MPRLRDPWGWLGVVGVLTLSLGAFGCPGNLDPSLDQGGGGGGGGGGIGTDGGTGTGCTNGGADLILGATCAANAAFCHGCAYSGCHDSITVEAGLDLTPDANVGKRLVGVVSQGTSGTPPGAGDSVCGGFATPYLNPGSNPATGLLINKVTLPAGSSGLCPGGSPMPYPGTKNLLLTAAELSCIESWAEGLIMAAGQ